jgi:transmembrane secretion effector
VSLDARTAARQAHPHATQLSGEKRAQQLIQVGAAIILALSVGRAHPEAYRGSRLIANHHEPSSGDSRAARAERAQSTFFHEPSWVKHLRQHERITVSDRAVEERIRRFHVAGAPPAVTHLIAAH